ncbi:MAG: thioredoxin [Candidatus Sumerlaeaceae bacterium]
MDDEIRETQCPKCGQLSRNPEVCEACGAVLTRMRGRSYAEDLTASDPISRAESREHRYTQIAQEKPRRPWLTIGAIAAAAAAAAGGFYYFNLRDTTSPNRVKKAAAATPAHPPQAKQTLTAEEGPSGAITIRARAQSRSAKLTPAFDATELIDRLGKSLKSNIPELSKATPTPTPTPAPAAASVTEISNRAVAAVTDLKSILQSSAANQSPTTTSPELAAFSTREAPVTIDLHEELFVTGRGATRPKMVQRPVPRPMIETPKTIGGIALLQDPASGAAAGSVIPITGASFPSQVLAHAGTPVLVDFYAAWCGPCRRLAPSVELVASEFGHKLKVVKLDIDENPDITTHYNVRAFPTLVLFKGGREVNRAVGVIPIEQLRSLVQAQL